MVHERRGLTQRRGFQTILIGCEGRGQWVQSLLCALDRVVLTHAARGGRQRDSARFRLDVGRVVQGWGLGNTHVIGRGSRGRQGDPFVLGLDVGRDVSEGRGRDGALGREGEPRGAPVLGGAEVILRLLAPSLGALLHPATCKDRNTTVPKFF